MSVPATLPSRLPCAQVPQSRRAPSSCSLLCLCFCFLPSLLPDTAVVQQMSHTCCPYVCGSGLRGDRAGAGLSPPPSARPEGDGWGCSLSSLLSFTKPPKGWALHSWLCQSCSLSHRQRWMCKESRFSITEGMLAHNEEERAVAAAALSVWRWAVPSPTKEPIPCLHWVRWAGAMSGVMKCSVLQTCLLISSQAVWTSAAAFFSHAVAQLMLLPT